MPTDKKILEYWDYNKNKTKPSEALLDHKYHFKCKRCGYEWSSTIAVRLNGTNCPSCRENKF